MSSFVYKAKNSSGSIVEGIVEASDARNAAASVREMGLWPVDIHPVKTERKPQPLASGGLGPIWTGVSLQAQALFFNQLDTMIKAGMGLGEALDALSRQRAMCRLPAIAARAAEHVRAGGQLSEIMEQYPFVFSSITMGLIRAGEYGGMLHSMTGQIANHIERELEIKHLFSRVTFYPKIILVFIIAAVLFVPRMAAIVNDGMPVVLDVLRQTVLPLALFLLLLWVVARVLFAVRPIRIVWDSIVVSIPVIGDIVRKLAMSRFSAALSTCYSAGIPFADAVEYAADAMGNEGMKGKIMRVVPKIRGGSGLHKALAESRAFPPMVLDMIATGETTGNMSQVLEQVSEHSTQEAKLSTEKLAYVLFAMLILAAGIVVLLIVSDFYGNYAGGMLQQ